MAKTYTNILSYLQDRLLDSTGEQTSLYGTFTLGEVAGTFEGFGMDFFSGTSPETRAEDYVNNHFAHMEELIKNQDFRDTLFELGAGSGVEGFSGHAGFSEDQLRGILKRDMVEFLNNPGGDLEGLAAAGKQLRSSQAAIAEWEKKSQVLTENQKVKEAAANKLLSEKRAAAAAAAERASKAKALADAARIRADNAKGLSSAVGINVSSSASSYLNRNAVMTKTAEEINRKEIAGVNIVQGDTESQGPGKQKRRALSSSLGINV